MSDLPVIIVGAGLAGSLMAIYLAKKGLKVAVYESRPDMRKTVMSAGRSINLALSDRGILALQEAGIADQVLLKAIPMPGRMIHSQKGDLSFSPYGKDSSQHINSISRGGLNELLMTEAEKYKEVSFYFNQKCIDVDFKQCCITVENPNNQEVKTIKGQTIIGGDGANSAVRTALCEQVEEATATVEWLEHGYKELNIPPIANRGFALEKNALHIWPRGHYMLIALPNPDGSFTCTLFFPHKGKISFEGLNSSEKVQAFFEEQFGDAVPHLKELLHEFENNEVGLLGTLSCTHWVYEDKAVLIGDAAHAVVPFYGQGMNASFEDCRVLSACIDKYGLGNWSEIYAAYFDLRKANGDAIGKLAVENFYEMRDHVADPVFQKKRSLEHLLENTFEDYHSKYSLVTFCPQIDYKTAQDWGNKQDAFLMDFCKDIDDIKRVDLIALFPLLQQLKN